MSQIWPCSIYSSDIGNMEIGVHILNASAILPLVVVWYSCAFFEIKLEFIIQLRLYAVYLAILYPFANRPDTVARIMRRDGR